MKLGFSGEGFANLLTLSTLTGALLVFVIFFIAYKRGIEVTSSRFQIKVIVAVVFLFIVIPLWFSDLDILWKFIATIVPSAVGAANYFAIDKMQKYLRDHFGDKNKKKE